MRASKCEVRAWKWKAKISIFEIQVSSWKRGALPHKVYWRKRSSGPSAQASRACLWQAQDRNDHQWLALRLGIGAGRIRELLWVKVAKLDAENGQVRCRKWILKILGRQRGQPRRRRMRQRQWSVSKAVAKGGKSATVLTTDRSWQFRCHSLLPRLCAQTWEKATLGFSPSKRWVQQMQLKYPKLPLSNGQKRTNFLGSRCVCWAVCRKGLSENRWVTALLAVFSPTPWKEPGRNPTLSGERGTSPLIPSVEGKGED